MEEQCLFQLNKQSSYLISSSFKVFGWSFLWFSQQPPGGANTSGYKHLNRLLQHITTHV